MLQAYLPALVFLFLGAVFGGLFAVHQRRARPAPAEQGQAASPTSRASRRTSRTNFRFGISFYLIAMLFILFDIEVVFLYPVAVQLEAFGTFALVETIVFIALLFVAFVYVWRRGALEWK